MQFQRCPICHERNDVSVYVHGQQAKCRRCSTPFPVDHESPASNPSERRPSPLPAAVAERPTEISRAGLGATRAVGGDDAASAWVGAPSPAPLPTAVAPALEPPLRSAELFPTPAQRLNSPARADAEADAPTDAGPAQKLGPQIPGYACVQLLGRGGMGEVWKAKQASLDRTVAVKLLSPTLAVEPDFVRRFERESTALAALAHPHIVSVFDRGSANGHWYFVMEYVEGRSLRDRVAEKKPDHTELLRLLAEVARAVEYAHQKGVVHRDLKPENILVDHTGRAKVADFGLAGMSEVGRSSLTMSSVAMGTAHYMAPEQRRDAKKVDGRADLYSMGVMLYELLTGELPLGRFPAPREKVPELDRRLDDMILRLLEQDPAKRPARASDVADLLEKLGRDDRRRSQPGLARTQVLSTVVRDVRESPAKRGMLWGAGALLLLVLVVAVTQARTAGPVRGRLPAKVDRAGTRASVTFGVEKGSIADAVLRVGDGWRVEKSRLVFAGDRGESAVIPRAFLMPLRVEFGNATVETEVVFEDGGAHGSPPRAELLLYRDHENHAGLRLNLGEDGGYALFHAVKGVATDAVTGDFDAKPGRAYQLALMLVNGQLTAMIDRKAVGSVTVKGLDGVKAKAAVGCVGLCRFGAMKLSGSVQDPPAPKLVKPARVQANR